MAWRPSATQRRRNYLEANQPMRSKQLLRVYSFALRLLRWRPAYPLTFADACAIRSGFGCSVCRAGTSADTTPNCIGELLNFFVGVGRLDPPTTADPQCSVPLQKVMDRVNALLT